MRKIKKCEACGGEAEYRVEGHTQGFFCAQCGWNLVTTYIPEIEQDITKYRMYLIDANSHNTVHIKSLAKVSNLNFVQTKKMIQQEKPLILEAEALSIAEAQKILDDCEIEYEVEPPFPY